MFYIRKNRNYLFTKNIQPRFNLMRSKVFKFYKGSSNILYKNINLYKTFYIILLHLSHKMVFEWHKLYWYFRKFADLLNMKFSYAKVEFYKRETWINTIEDSDAVKSGDFGGISIVPLLLIYHIISIECPTAAAQWGDLPSCCNCYISSTRGRLLRLFLWKFTYKSRGQF